MSKCASTICETASTGRQQKKLEEKETKSAKTASRHSMTEEEKIAEDFFLNTHTAPYSIKTSLPENLILPIPVKNQEISMKK